MITYEEVLADVTRIRAEVSAMRPRIVCIIASEAWFAKLAALPKGHPMTPWEVPVVRSMWLHPGDAFAEFSDGTIKRIAGKPVPEARTEEQP